MSVHGSANQTITFINSFNEIGLTTTYSPDSLPNNPIKLIIFYRNNKI